MLASAAGDIFRGDDDGGLSGVCRKTCRYCYCSKPGMGGRLDATNVVEKTVAHRHHAHLVRSYGISGRYALPKKSPGKKPGILENEYFLRRRKTGAGSGGGHRKKSRRVILRRFIAMARNGASIMEFIIRRSARCHCIRRWQEITNMTMRRLPLPASSICRNLRLPTRILKPDLPMRVWPGRLQRLTMVLMAICCRRASNYGSTAGITRRAAKCWREWLSRSRKAKKST